MLAANVTMGYLFETVKIGLDNKCFTFPDKRSFCTNDKYTLKFYVDHHQVPDLSDYVFKDQDRLLISYGNENDTQINTQLARVDGLQLIT
jgi:hypothetical protein